MRNWIFLIALPALALVGACAPSEANDKISGAIKVLETADTVQKIHENAPSIAKALSDSSVMLGACTIAKHRLDSVKASDAPIHTQMGLMQQNYDKCCPMLPAVASSSILSSMLPFAPTLPPFAGAEGTATKVVEFAASQIADKAVESKLNEVAAQAKHDINVQVKACAPIVAFSLLTQ